MVKRGSSTFSTSSVARGSIVLSKAFEKQFALEAEISQLRHHVLVLSKRLHSVTLEKQVLEDIVESTMSGERQPLDEEEVAEEEAAPSVAGEESRSATVIVVGEEKEKATEIVAGEVLEDATVGMASEEDEARMIVASPVVAQEPEPSVAEPTSCEVPEMAEDCNRFAMDLVEDIEPTPPPPPVSSRRTELAEMMRRVQGLAKMQKELIEGKKEWEKNNCPYSTGEEIDKGTGRRLGSSGDENAVIGGVIVAGGASTKRKNAAQRKKRKLIREEERRENEGW